jgi:tetratricopeptide (TPR) repeat protein
MDAADLEYRTRTLTACIPSHLVSRLLELGHGEEVEFQAGRGEWFCARAWARLLGEQGRQAEALEVLAPYIASGWWNAARAAAELLEEWGRVEEAISMARPSESGERIALEYYGRLLARHGRADEAFELLRPHIEDWFLAAALVDVAQGAGRDEDAATLLAERIQAEGRHRCDTPGCTLRRVEPFNAIGLLAAIRERQGRVDEAIALLHTRDTTSVNNRDQFADLLARHDRIEELRAYAATDSHGHAAQRLAQVLEETGDVEGAIAVYHNPKALQAHRFHRAVHLAQLLVRHDRREEAIAVVREVADSPGGAEDWIVHTLCDRYAEQGRPQDGLDFLDALKARCGGEEVEFFMMRLPLMAARGRREEAIELMRAHPEGDTWYAARAIAALLADAGHTEEAVAVLQQDATGNRSVLAWHLIDLGRVKDAITLLQQPKPRPDPADDPWAAASTDAPPF